MHRSAYYWQSSCERSRCGLPYNTTPAGPTVPVAVNSHATLLSTIGVVEHFVVVIISTKIEPNSQLDAFEYCTVLYEEVPPKEKPSFQPTGWLLQLG